MFVAKHDGPLRLLRPQTERGYAVATLFFASVSGAVAIRASPCSIPPMTLALHFEPVANVDDQRLAHCLRTDRDAKLVA